MLFPAGIMDTKYIAEFHQRENRSFLSYLYRKAYVHSAQPRAPGKDKLSQMACVWNPCAACRERAELAQAEATDRLQLSVAPAVVLPAATNGGSALLDRMRAQAADAARQICGQGTYCQFFAVRPTPGARPALRSLRTDPALLGSFRCRTTASAAWAASVPSRTISTASWTTRRLPAPRRAASERGQRLPQRMPAPPPLPPTTPTTSALKRP